MSAALIAWVSQTNLSSVLQHRVLAFAAAAVRLIEVVVAGSGQPILTLYGDEDQLLWPRLAPTGPWLVFLDRDLNVRYNGESPLPDGNLTLFVVKSVFWVLRTPMNKSNISGFQWSHTRWMKTSCLYYEPPEFSRPRFPSFRTSDTQTPVFSQSGRFYYLRNDVWRNDSPMSVMDALTQQKVGIVPNGDWVWVWRGDDYLVGPTEHNDKNQLVIRSRTGTLVQMITLDDHCCQWGWGNNLNYDGTYFIHNAFIYW